MKYWRKKEPISLTSLETALTAADGRRWNMTGTKKEKEREKKEHIPHKS
jgi:hypothetical protein